MAEKIRFCVKVSPMHVNKYSWKVKIAKVIESLETFIARRQYPNKVQCEQYLHSAIVPPLSREVQKIEGESEQFKDESRTQGQKNFQWMK